MVKKGKPRAVEKKGLVADCCHLVDENKGSCQRVEDGKVFTLPRRFSRQTCNQGIKGFTMRSSCAPYKNCPKNENVHVEKGTKKNKKRQNGDGNKAGKKKFLHAVAVLHNNSDKIEGTVYFKQSVNARGKRGPVGIRYVITGLENGAHGFHIHEYGDLTDRCEKACAHFNPHGETHGGLTSNSRHLGDLGNISSKGRKAIGRIVSDSISLETGEWNSIIGRSVIIHEDKDDLGKGGHTESLRTGNAGRRLACGVIGLAKGS